MGILTQFIFRLSFGLATAMAITPASQVTSGFYRNHLYVLLGLSALATAVALGGAGNLAVWPPLVSAIVCYIGSVAWLYEKRGAGVTALVAVAALTLIGALVAMPATSNRSTAAAILWFLDPVTGGLVLGTTIGAMFLGHWYLNTPTMELAPLKRLVIAMAIAIVARAIVCGAGLALWLASDSGASAGGAGAGQSTLIALRWIAGIVGALVVAWMTWQTLKVPNTQSATGILYVGVIVTFLGELTSQLLSAGSPFPL